MKYFKSLSPLHITEDLKQLLDLVHAQVEDKIELLSDIEDPESSYTELALSVSQSTKIPLIAELSKLPEETNQIILLILLEDRYFLKHYQYEIIAAVINSITKKALPISVESFLEHYEIAWTKTFSQSSKSKSVWLFHYDCRFWLLLLRIIVRSIEQGTLEDKELLCNSTLEKVLCFKDKFKGYGHFPEVAPLIVALIKSGSKDLIEKLKQYYNKSIPKVVKQFELMQSFSLHPEEMIVLFLQAYDNVPSEKWVSRWNEIFSQYEKYQVRDLCDNLWVTYLPTEEQCQKLAHLSGGTLDMEVILGIQRQLYQDFQDMTEYEELGRNITRAALWSYGLLQDTANIKRLYDFCYRYNQFNEFSRAAIYSLECIESKETLKTLQNIQTFIKARSNKIAINDALQKQGLKLGYSLEVLKDITTDDCGLDIEGKHFWILGRDMLVNLCLFDNGSILLEYIDKKSGEKVKLPSEELKLKYDDDFVSISEMHQLLMDTLANQSSRLEKAMCQQRQWKYSLWKDIYDTNPINKNLARRLLWAVYDDNDHYIDSFIPVNGTEKIFLSGEERELTDLMFLKIQHPVLLEEAMLAKAKQIMSESGIKQPFVQLERKIYKLSEGKDNDKVYSDYFNGNLVVFKDFQEKMKSFSWAGFELSDFDETENKHKDYTVLLWRAFLNIDLAGINIWNVDAEVLLKDIHFCKLEKRGKHFRASSEKSLLSEVNSIVYSETMLDISNTINVKQV